MVGENPLVRLNSFMEAYHVLFYAVQRTDAAKKCFLHSSQFSNTLFKELSSSISQVLTGNIGRVSVPYFARNTAPSESYIGWHPHQIIAQSPEVLFSDYVILRDVIINSLENKEKDLADKLDLIFLTYLGNFIKPDLMSYISEQRIAKNFSGEKTTKLFWQKFVSNHDRTMHRRVPLFDSNSGIF